MANGGKVRIYELAKELGLQNKVVIALCEQLGIEGKTSHSNSLTEDEAEKLRRSVIRRAVSGKKVNREVERAGGIFTERRVGNVVRRRKRDAKEATSSKTAADDNLESKKAIDLSSVPAGNAFEELEPNLKKEDDSRKEALARADAIFSKSNRKKLEDADKTKQSDRKLDESEELTSQLEASDDETPEKEVVDVIQDEAPIELEGADADPVKADSTDLGDSEIQPGEKVAKEPQVDVSESPVMESAKDAVDHVATDSGPVATDKADSQASVDNLEDVRRRHDIRAPKILGRIELPQEKDVAKAKPVEKKHAASLGESVAEGSSRKKKVNAELSDDYSKKKRRRKQVVVRDDFLDYNGDGEWRQKRDKRKKRRTDVDKTSGSTEITVPKASKRIVKIEQNILVGELAKTLGVKVGEVIKHLMSLGVMSNVNQYIDFDTATLVAEEFNFTTQSVGETEEEFLAKLNVADESESLELRPPIVTVMGHVDHGKTSLLDSIRKTQVVEGEAGGITQHIGAYVVETGSGGKVTFLDTPGHAAFTAMRGRGAQITDIVVLVVAADDGVMPQTIEAINHAKAAEVPIIVAINKMDKEGAQPDRIKQQIGEHGLVPEDWGGDTIIVPVSAHTGQGIEDLLEHLYLQAEILELKANPNRAAIGRIIESRLDRSRGPVISVLVQNGTLRQGDVFLSGPAWGKVRALTGSDAKPVDEAGPSIPVEVLGVASLPSAGDDFYVLSSESEARRLSDERMAKKREQDLVAKSPVGTALTLESFSAMVSSSGTKELTVIVKADVQGSVGAVTGAFSQLETEEVKIKIVHKGVGAVTENDVQLAVASKAVIVAFNVRADPKVSQLAEKEGIQVVYSRVIYELIDTVKAAMSGLLDPVEKEQVLGRAEVRQTFRVPKLGTIAGSYIVDGKVERNSMVRLLRDNVVVFEGQMASLRRFKEDVKEVQSGYECGIGIQGYSDIQDGDILEVYKIIEVQQSL